ncbi:E3 ubiquitin-protein ligase CHFR isoform X2 [Bombina bombina]|uniref:E3 ubiquitin-protein ligase CHFR isoform X2 n=1 Tax=Bombina bombina TaxID=8345 RepID=UPI00235AE15D|nr:E3 ubiquitin-protein ligase CHFR isoform X2 [Bombina bombina]
MESSREKKPWGKLSPLLGSETESASELFLCKKEWTIGRKKACDLSFPGNKLVSGEHCKITVEEKSGHVFLEDTSTNGTVINKLKLVKKQTCPLQNGDVIYLVYKKNEPEQNVAYLYKSLNSSSDNLQEPVDTSGDERGDETQLLSSQLSYEEPQTSYEEPQPSTSTSNFFSTPTTSSNEPNTDPQQSTTAPESAGRIDHAQKLPVDLGAPGFLSETSQSVGSVFPGLTSPASDDDAHPPRKKIRTDEDYPATQTPAQSQRSKGLPEDVKTSIVKPDKMEETLTCIICQELLHDCVSLQPCMHTFCAACYSGWMDRSSLCPTCRCPVERICKNHILNNLVEAYLLQHPDKCRSEEDRRSMDARNKITQDMLQPKVRRSFSDEEGSSEDLLELSDVDSESSDISQQYTVCRQCPGYGRHNMQIPPYPQPPPSHEAEASRAVGDAPSTSANFPAVVQEYVCPAQGSHIICTCCFQPMPDRRAEREQNSHVAPQQCSICLQPFCHMYWGCTRMGCFGCLAPFCELNLGDKCLDAVLNNNNYESDILKNYLASRGLTWKDLLNESLSAVQRGVFMLPDYRINGTTVLCYFCGLRNFRDLTYQYRQNIPATELPAVASRPNCYWGRNCRTQVKAHHAMKFNHICEQTRFKN